MELEKWYYVNVQYYPYLTKKKQLIIKEDIDRYPSKDEIDDRDIMDMPLVFTVYLTKDVDEYIKELKEKK